MGPTLNKIKKKAKEESEKGGERGRGRDRRYFIFYFFLSLLSSIYGNQTVRIRRGKKQSALLDEGYAWEPKTWDFAEFLIKILKILCFGFSQIYGFLLVRIGRAEGQIDPRIVSYAWVPKYLSFIKLHKVWIFT